MKNMNFRLEILFLISITSRYIEFYLFATPILVWSGISIKKVEKTTFFSSYLIIS